MSDLDNLLAAFDSGQLLRLPNHPLNIVDLSRALASLCGATEVESTPGSEELARLIGPSDHLVFVLVDGLGMVFLDTLPPDSFLRHYLVAELRTVFPSSSATAITSLATGQWPSTHGVTGR
ncbi:MAG: alkaline phosphatase family protein, partial [Dehalococcoidia bacterium]